MITGEIYLGEAQDANKQTGHAVYLVYRAEEKPIMESCGGGWYEPTGEMGWQFEYRAKHKNAWWASPWPKPGPLEKLLEEAAADLKRRHRCLAS